MSKILNLNNLRETKILWLTPMNKGFGFVNDHDQKIALLFQLINCVHAIENDTVLSFVVSFTWTIHPTVVSLLEKVVIDNGEGTYVTSTPMLKSIRKIGRVMIRGLFFFFFIPNLVTLCL